MIQQPMRRENCVVRLDNTGRKIGCWIDFEPNLGFLAVVDSNALKDQSSESGTGTASDGMIDNEPLYVLRVVCKFPQTVIDLIKNLFSYGVVATGEVVCSIL